MKCKPHYHGPTLRCCYVSNGRRVVQRKAGEATLSRDCWETIAQPSTLAIALQRMEASNG